MVVLREQTQMSVNNSPFSKFTVNKSTRNNQISTQYKLLKNHRITRNNSSYDEQNIYKMRASNGRRCRVDANSP